MRTAWLVAFALAVPSLSHAASPTPTPAPTPAAGDSSEDLPTMTDSDPVPAAPTGDPEWDAGASTSGILLGLRAGFHAFEPSNIGYGGLAFEVTAAMPITGSFYAAGVAGYRTGFVPAGYDEPDPKARFFDVQFGAVEGQYRRNLGRVNMMGGVGVGLLAANSSEVTLEDGSPTSTSGSGALAHVMAGATVPVGRLAVVGQLRYSFAPVDFSETEETLGMGGLTLAAGVDFAF